MKHRFKKGGLALLCTGLLLLSLWHVSQWQSQPHRSLTADKRTLLRIWVINAPGGAQTWLKAQLRLYEKQHPGVSTYLRSVSAAELTQPEAILPDAVFYMSGDITAPADFFIPLGGAMLSRGTGLLREELLRCGRWQHQQYGLPVCWGAWVLVIDSALEPGSAHTPAPTTLLGRPAATPESAAIQAPEYPMEAAMQADCPLQSPGGAALFTLGLLLEELPPLPDSFGTLSANEVYSAFRQQKCATAMLTTRQAAALAGSSFSHRCMAADEIITDQVWLASLTADAPPEAALLLSHLASTPAQKALSVQGLQTVRTDLTLYAAGLSARVEQAARSALTAISAYTPAADLHASAWQFFTRRLTLDEALLPLL